MTPSNPKPGEGQVPGVPEGAIRPYWCCVEIAPGRTRYRLLEYANRYEMPCADNAEPPDDAIPVPGSDEDYYWSGWIEFSCEHCEIHWTFSGKVLSWIELPDTDETFAQHARLLTELESKQGVIYAEYRELEPIGAIHASRALAIRGYAKRMQTENARAHETYEGMNHAHSQMASELETALAAHARLLASNAEMRRNLIRVTNELRELIKGEHDDESVGITGWDSLHESVAESDAALARHPEKEGV